MIASNTQAFQRTGVSGRFSISPQDQSQSLQRMRVHVPSAPLIATHVRTPQARLYLFAASNVGLMPPTVDALGNIWVGEMNANSLGHLNSRTGTVTSWIYPDTQ